MHDEKVETMKPEMTGWGYTFTILKSVGPKLVPFLKTLGMYFVIFIPSDQPSLFAMLIKCLPVASLALFVLLHGVSLGHEHAFARKILAGLLVSCVGDAFLVWPNYFLHGMFSFGVAQVFYIWAFGFEPESWTLGVVIYALTSIGLGMIMPGLMGTEGGLIVGVPIYFILLTTMLWRAVARFQMFEDIFTWTKICSFFGGVCFVISDSVLGLNKFFTEIPNSQTIIMITYYMAQLGMALSVVNAHKGGMKYEHHEGETIDMEGVGCNRNTVINTKGKKSKSSFWKPLPHEVDSDSSS